ncbi:hypothetical protein ACNF42_05260 [Cuniculiplasma sp. SKW3]|uniref:hypothetical protein n=1 Tax=unclassified Cuniculiplasma TaxID=2619706 RepID=UPI003FD383AA
MKITEKNIINIMEMLSKMDMIEIKKGGKYRVLSQSGKDDPMETNGEFAGYTILGEDGALVFKVDGEKALLRLIPVSNLIAIEFSPDEIVQEKKKEVSRDSINYIS